MLTNVCKKFQKQASNRNKQSAKILLCPIWKNVIQKYIHRKKNGNKIQQQRPFIVWILIIIQRSVILEMTMIFFIISIGDFFHDNMNNSAQLQSYQTWTFWGHEILLYFYTIYSTIKFNPLDNAYDWYCLRIN